MVPTQVMAGNSLFFFFFFFVLFFYFYTCRGVHVNVVLVMGREGSCEMYTGNPHCPSLEILSLYAVR